MKTIARFIFGNDFRGTLTRIMIGVGLFMFSLGVILQCVIMSNRAAATYLYMLIAILGLLLAGIGATLRSHNHRDA